MGENFPVSVLLPRPLRAPVRTAYHLARRADDIADDPARSPAARLAALEALAPEIAASPPPVRRALAGLMVAFRRDASAGGIESLAALDAYCRYSAAPIADLLLDLCAAPDRARAPAQALAKALQILNHLQDARGDWLRLGRSYLPGDLLAAAGLGPEAVARDPPPPALRAVYAAVHAAAVADLAHAALLPHRLADTPLRRQAAVTLHLARRLADRLAREDPLAARVRLGMIDWLTALIAGWRGGAGPPPADFAAILALPGLATSSFRRAILGLGGDAGRALVAVYGFCRWADDIADGAPPTLPAFATTPRRLADWRAILATGRADDPLGRCLLWALDRFDLPAAACQQVLDGLSLDVTGVMRAPARGVLRRYCRAVAGAPGLLVLGVCGVRGILADELAASLGEAVQLTNILRDIAEDAAIGRLYLPRELLTTHGINPAAPDLLRLTDPALPAACRALALEARRAFAASAGLIPLLPRPARRLVGRLAAKYAGLLDRLIAQGWSFPGAA